MANMFTVRNLPKGIRDRLRAYAHSHDMKTGEALSILLLRGMEHQDDDRPYSIADWRKFTVKGRHTDGSMRVDEVVYGVGRPKK